MTGASFASFACLLAYRFFQKQSTKDILFKKSHCESCRANLSALELVPIFSYIFLRGQCKKCKAKISTSYFLCECLGGLFFISIFYRFNNVYEYAFILSIFAILSATFLLCLCLIDLKILAVPNFILYLSVASLFVFGFLKIGIINSIVSSLILGILFWLICLVVSYFSKKRVIGSADIWLIFGFGGAVGVFDAFLALYFAAVLNLFYALIAKKKKIAFIPFLTAGFWFSLLFADNIFQILI